MLLEIVMNQLIHNSFLPLFLYFCFQSKIIYGDDIGFPYSSGILLIYAVF